MWLLIHETDHYYEELDRIPIALFDDVVEAMIWADTEEEPNERYPWRWDDVNNNFSCGIERLKSEATSWVLVAMPVNPIEFTD